ncbi:HD domain-containing protein [Paraburkholderia xenovorans]|uniref:HD domain-containing protein n=1 Tax=Paraburkholderia xenovorans TaxID=36873 RepID=UPI0038BAA0A8
MSANPARHHFLISHIENEFLARDDVTDRSHDINHARRVMHSALAIAAKEGGGNEEVIIAAAYLHDWINLPKNHPDRHLASALSADAARPILKRIGFSPANIDATAHAILTHSFSAGVQPETIEAQALQDADRLEALGAIGLARVFTVAGQLGTELFCADDPFALHRRLDDRRYAVDHFAVKLLKLPETMQTDAGRVEAEKRCIVLRSFLHSLAEELRSPMRW